MKYPTTDSSETGNNEHDLKIRFHNLLETLPVMEDAITELLHDFLNDWDSSDHQRKISLLERYVYFAEKVIKKSPDWSAVCDAYASTICSEGRFIIELREIIAVIEKTMGWIYSLIKDEITEFMDFLVASTMHKRPTQ